MTFELGACSSRSISTPLAADNKPMAAGWEVFSMSIGQWNLVHQEDMNGLSFYLFNCFLLYPLDLNCVLLYSYLAANKAISMYISK